MLCKNLKRHYMRDDQQLRAFIVKSTEFKQATTPLYFKGSDPKFFIEPITSASTFLSSIDKKVWQLTFFRGSTFVQELVVYIGSNEDHREKPLGKACWLNNSDIPDNNECLVEQASEFLRKTKTLPIDRGSVLTPYRMLIADGGGIAYLSKDPEQFRRIVLCQSLILAYRLALNECISRLATFVKKDSAVDTLGLYEDVIRFNAAHYFSLPVLIERHEMFAASQVLREHYKIDLLNKELTEQLSDVAAIMQSERERDQAKRNAQQATEDALQRRREDNRNRRNSLLLAALGVLLTAFSLLSLFQLSPQQFDENVAGWRIRLFDVKAESAHNIQSLSIPPSAK